MRKLLWMTFCSLFLLNNAGAVEYVTLSKSNKTRSVPSNSLVEVVGYSGTISPVNDFGLRFTLANTDTFYVSLVTTYADGFGAAAYQPTVGRVFTGVTYIEALMGNQSEFAITVKITPATEINPVGPNTFLVLPEGSTGEYDVIVEYSTDLTNWNPFMSQTVDSQFTPSFFRARILKKAAP